MPKRRVEEEPRQQKRTKTELILIPPVGDRAEDKLSRGVSIARAAGIELFQLFLGGDYKSPEETAEFLRSFARKNKVDSVDLTELASYLVGALDAVDFSSPLRQDRLGFHDDAEHTLRQAATTLLATVESLQTTELGSKKGK